MNKPFCRFIKIGDHLIATVPGFEIAIPVPDRQTGLRLAGAELDDVVRRTLKRGSPQPEFQPYEDGDIGLDLPYTVVMKSELAKGIQASGKSNAELATSLEKPNGTIEGLLDTDNTFALDDMHAAFLVVGRRLCWTLWVVSGIRYPDTGLGTGWIKDWVAGIDIQRVTETGAWTWRRVGLRSRIERKTRGEVLEVARQAVEAGYRASLADDWAFPYPNPPKAGETPLEICSELLLKMELISAFRLSGRSVADLAREADLPVDRVQQVLDPETPIDLTTIDQIFSGVNRYLHLDVRTPEVPDPIG